MTGEKRCPKCGRTNHGFACAVDLVEELAMEEIIRDAHREMTLLEVSHFVRDRRALP